MHEVSVVDDRLLALDDLITISFQLTTKLAAAEAAHPAPSSLGALPIARAKGAAAAATTIHAPEVIVALRRHDAFWLGLATPAGVACAVKLRIGEADAVSGEPWRDGLHAEPQDYVVCPPQRSFDGPEEGAGRARQFVASAELRRTGIRIVAYALEHPEPAHSPARSDSPMKPLHAPARAGSLVTQSIAPDPYGPPAWQHEPRFSVSVQFAAPAEFARLTGGKMPKFPARGGGYTGFRLP